MAYRINCGKPERNEVEPLNRLAAELPDSWALFTNIPRHLTGPGPKGREIDALALSPLGAVVIECKNFGGLIQVCPAGEWFVDGRFLTNRDGNPQFPLQQAGKAAQTLKSALGEPAKSVYIEACAVATRPGASIRFSDPLRPQPIMALDQAIKGIEALARTTRGVPYPALQAFFDLVGHGIPPPLEADWRRTAAPESPIFSANQARRSRPRSVRQFHGNTRTRRERQAGVPFGWLLFATIAGALIGLYALSLSGSP